MNRYLTTPMLMAAVALGSFAPLPSHAAEGLVCTSNQKVYAPSGNALRLTNTMLFSCGTPATNNKTISQLSAGGWIIIQVQSVLYSPTWIAWQLIIQK